MWVSKIAKYQISSTKPGPRPEGGDSEGEISGGQVSFSYQVSGVRFQEKDTKKLKPVGAKRKSRLKRSDSGKHCNLKPSI